MTDWVPQVAPDFCPACGVYWECEHRSVGAALTVEDIRPAVQHIKSADPLGDHLMQQFMEENARPGFAPPHVEDPPFDPNVQPALRYIDEDADDA